MRKDKIINTSYFTIIILSDAQTKKKKKMNPYFSYICGDYSEYGKIVYNECKVLLLNP